MGTFNGSAKGGAFSTASRSNRTQKGAGLQILFSLLLLADLFLLYTIIMQMTHLQKAFEASDTVNLILLIVLAIGAVALIYAVIRSGAWKRALCILLICSVLYLAVVYSDIPLIKNARETWITTAMATMRHQGLATYYFPSSVVEKRTEELREALNAQIGENTPEDAFTVEASDQVWITGMETDTRWGEPAEVIEELTPEQQAFYLLFYELDIDSCEAWIKTHPDALTNGYAHLLINEAGLEKNGTTIRTKLGEKVLAVDADNQILVVETDCGGARGVLAIAKQPARLHLCATANLPYHGDTVGTIASRNNGVLAMTGSSFIDVNAEGEAGKGNGGMIAGWAMCGGKTYGEHFGWGYKRLELRDDDWFYIADAPAAVGKGTTDAMEFQPAMVINGVKQNVGYWTDKNPRACIGQSKRGEILMLGVEGRGAGGSWGCSVSNCSDVLLTHDCITALNCDGGTTAILWYRGEPILRCSNSAIPQGRRLPTAWVYVSE